MYYAFIQFAGFTMGKAISPFSAPWTNYPGNNFDALVGGGGTVTGVNQFIYTAQFGNGVSGTIGVQDQVAYYQAGVNNISAGGLFGTSDYAGTIAPDIIGVFKLTRPGACSRLRWPRMTTMPRITALLKLLAILATGGVGQVSWPCRSRPR